MQKTFLYHKKKIFYRVIGNGSPVVFIHGFGEDGSIWKDQIEYLKNKFQLIIPDLPGSGQSEMIEDLKPPQTPPKEGLAVAQTQPDEKTLQQSAFKFIIPDLPGSGQSEMIEDMSIEGMAEVIKEILEVEASKVPPSGGFRGACIIGHSMGGYITLALVEKYWNHVSAFGLFHSTAYPDTEEKKAIRRKGIEFIRQHGVFEFLKTTTPNLFSPQTKEERPEIIDEFMTGLNNFSAEALVSYYEAMIARPDRTAILQKATVPVLFIVGEYDNAVPIQDSLKQCHLPEKSYIHILRKSGHMGMLEEKDRCNDILEEFLREI